MAEEDSDLRPNRLHETGLLQLIHGEIDLLGHKDLYLHLILSTSGLSKVRIGIARSKKGFFVSPAP